MTLDELIHELVVIREAHRANGVKPIKIRTTMPDYRSFRELVAQSESLSVELDGSFVVIRGMS